MAKTSVLRPFPPMRGIDVDALSRFRFDPSVKHSTARKDEWLHAVIVDDCEHEFSIKWRSGNRSPFTVYV